MKIVFISSDVSQSDILVNSFLDGIEYKITNQISLQDIPENATHVTFIYHARDFFPFVLKERYALYTQIHDLSFTLIPEEADDLSYVKVYDDNGELTEAYYVSKQNNKNQCYKRYPYIPDYHFISDDYIRHSNAYTELDKYQTDVSSDYFNDMMFLFDELEKRNKHIVIDFLTCNFIASKIQDIESDYTNLVMRVSTNDTGNPEYGGDWIMEYTSDETETAYVKDIYFNENIRQFSVILRTNFYSFQRADSVIVDLNDTHTQTNNGIKDHVNVLYTNNYMLFRFYNFSTQHRYFSDRDGNMILDNIYTSGHSTYTKRVKLPILVIPNRTQYIEANSDLGDYDNNGRAETTEDGTDEGVKTVQFEPRTTADKKCYIGPSTFMNHNSIEEIIIDGGFINFHSQYEAIFINEIFDGYNYSNKYYGGNTFRGMPQLTTLTLTGSDLTFIPPSAARDCVKLETVELGGNITTIEHTAFHNCYNLTSINLNNVTSIGSYAFKSCKKLTSVTLNDSIRIIPTELFRAANALKTINLENITEIQYRAFTYCKALDLIDISSIVTIEEKAFQFSNIKTFISPIGFDLSNSLDSSNMHNATITNLYYDVSFGIIRTDVSFNNGTITNAYGYEVLDDNYVLITEDVSLTEINGRTIVNSLDELNYILKSNGSKEQYNTSIDIYNTTFTNIQGDTLELNVAVDISNDAFKNTGISNIVFGASLETIGTNAFYDCDNLTSVDFSGCTSLTTIGTNAFKSCSYLTSVDFSGCTSLTTIGTTAFYLCSDLTSVDFTNCRSLETIKSGAFRNCTVLDSVDFSGCTSLRSIGTNAFKLCNALTSVDFTSCIDLSSIGTNAFSSCTVLESVDFTGCTSLEIIDDYAFTGCSELTSIVLSNCISLKTIGSYAFKWCKKLTSVDFTGCTSLKTIGTNAFYDCTTLLSVDFTGCTSLEIIDDYAFYICNALTSVDFTGCTSLTTIRTKAFYGCVKLLSVDLSNCTSLKTIEYNAFYLCNALTSVDFTNCISLETIGSSVFSSLNAITSVDFTNCTLLTSIESSAFSSFTVLESVDFSGCTSLETIGDNAFVSCSNLTSVDFTNCTDLSNIEHRAFYLCNNLKSLDFTDCTSLSSIGDSAFYLCNNLKSVDFTGCIYLTSIGDSAFYDCSNLSSVYLEIGIKTIGEYAFRQCELIDIFLLPIGFNWDISMDDNAFLSSNITNLYYDDSFGSISTSFKGGTIQNAYGYEVLNDNYVLITEDVSLTEINGRTIINSLDTYNYILGTNGSIKELNVLTEITNGTFTNIQTGDTLVLNVAVKILDDAFKNNADISSVVFGSALETIGTNAFKSCSDLTSVDFTNCTDLSSIGTDAFYQCNNLTSVDLTNCTSLTTIEKNAFKMSPTNEFESVQFPSSLTTIENGAFYYCGKLTNLDFSNCTSLTIIGTAAFYKCSSLISIIFPFSLETLGSQAFHNCNKITNIDLENTKIKTLNNVFNHAVADIYSITLPFTLIKINADAIKMKYSDTIIEELFLPPDISFNNTIGDSYIEANSFYNIKFTNLYYNKANGIFSSNSITRIKTIGYTIDGNDILLDSESYQNIGEDGKTIWDYNIKESTNITLSSSKSLYTIDLSNVSSETTFTFSRESTSTHLLKFSITSISSNNISSTDISYTNAITSETKTVSSSSIKSKYFNSDLAMTLNGDSSGTIKIEYIQKSNFNNNIGSDTYDILEAYDISSSQIKVTNDISDVTFIDSTISSIDFQNKYVSGLRFNGSFTIPNVTSVNETTLSSLYDKYSIISDKLYDKLYFTFEDVITNRNFTDNYGSDNSFNITSKKYYINGVETPQLQLIAGELYNCSFPDSSFGIFGDISNNTDASGFNANIFGGFGSLSCSDFSINSTSIYVLPDASGNYYYGHLSTHGTGGLNTNISIVDSVPVNWIQAKNSEHSSIITSYKVMEYSDILHHSYNHDGTGRIMQVVERSSPSGYSKGYINGYYNPKMTMKSGSDIIIEMTNIHYDSSTNFASEKNSQSPSIYIKDYNTSNIFSDIVDNHQNKVLNETTTSLQYVKLRCDSTNQYYIDHDIIQYINIDVSDTMTETISFEAFDFDIITGDQLSSISKIDQEIVVNDMKIRCNNVDISLSRLHTLDIFQAPKIRFTIEEQYTDDLLLTYLFYYKKLEYYGYLKTISTPYFGGIEQTITLNPLQTSFPFQAYMGSFIVTLNGKTHNKPIYTKVNEISKSDLDNLAYMISITGGLKTEEDIKNTLISKFDANTSIENNDKSSIIEIFLQQQMNNNISKIYTVKSRQTVNILGKTRKISNFFNTDEPVSDLTDQINYYKENGLSSSTYRPMTFGHCITGPNQILIQDPNDSERAYLSKNKLFIINHSIKTFVDATTGEEISFNTFISKRMNETTQNDVDISINYYREYKYPRREFDVTISGGKFEINYTLGSEYNIDFNGKETIECSGSALDENGNLNCNENEIYIFNQTDATNLDSNNKLNHAFTVYPTNLSGNPMKYANVNCIPSLGGPLTKTRILHCFKPKFFSEQMDTSKYYYGSLCEALDVSFGEWWMNELYDGANINIIVDVGNYESPSSFRFLKNHIRSIPLSKIKKFNSTGGNSYIVNGISSITLNDSGDVFSNLSSSLIYFHFDLKSVSINMSSDTTLEISTLSHITINKVNIYSHDISSIHIIEDGTVYPFTMDILDSIVISDISNSDISVNEIDYTLLDIESKHNYVFKPSSFYLNSDLSRSFIVDDVSNNIEYTLGETDISINNTYSIKFQKKDTSEIYTFGSNYDVNIDWSFIDTSMGAYINILPTIPIGDSKGYTIGDEEIIISRNAWEVKRDIDSDKINNQELYPITDTFTFDILDGIIP